MTNWGFGGMERSLGCFCGLRHLLHLAYSRSLGLVDTKGYYRRFADDPCSSLWLQRFKVGCKSRMGSDWSPNQAMIVPLLLEVLDWMEAKF